MSRLAPYSKVIAAVLPLVATVIIQMLGPDSPWITVVGAIVAVVSTYLAPANTPKPPTVSEGLRVRH